MQVACISKYRKDVQFYSYFFFLNQAKLYQDAIFHILEWQIPKTMIISTIGSTKEDCNSSSRKLNNNNYFPLQARNHLTFNHVSQ